jgi:hypothetical protein
LVHLVANLLVESLFLLAFVLCLTRVNFGVVLDLFEVLRHNSFVETFLLGHSLLVTREGILPSVFLHWIGVLDNARVSLRLNVTAIV